MRVLIIGGGASGLAAAITTARAGAKVMILESGKKCGRKLLLTGSGRCNLSNKTLPADAYHGSAAPLAQHVFLEEKEGLLSFFDSCGIVVRSVGEGIYPSGEEASSVLNALLVTAEGESVTIRNNTSVTDITPTEKGFLVMTDTWQYEADRVIVSTGSAAGKIAPECENISGILERLGHHPAASLPALVPLVLRGSAFGSWAGVRVRGSVQLLLDGTPGPKEEGQLQLTEYGISGIPVMNVSYAASRALFEGKSVTACLDFLPAYSENALAFLLEKRLLWLQRAGRISQGEGLAETAETLSSAAGRMLLTGLLPEKLAATIAKLAHSEAACTKAALTSLARYVKNARFEVTATKSMKEAQCATGGIPVQELYEETMESQIVPGLYITGEAVDADGICGGYNLTFAFLSGIRAGDNAAVQRNGVLLS